MKENVHFSSSSDEWATPEYIWKYMQHEVGRFDFDAAANAANSVAKMFTDDALNSVDWAGKTIWLNPPYSKIAPFMKKALHQSKLGKTIVCLVPARTCTAWWHDYAMKGEVRYLRGRLKFGDSKNAAPFPSAIVIFRG